MLSAVAHDSACVKPVKARCALDTLDLLATPHCFTHCNYIVEQFRISIIFNLRTKRNVAYSETVWQQIVYGRNTHLSQFSARNNQANERYTVSNNQVPTAISRAFPYKIVTNYV